jgi:sodium-dependent phosphate cotransporter
MERRGQRFAEVFDDDETFARIAAERKWVIAAYLITVFIALPALVIILVGVL